MIKATQLSLKELGKRNYKTDVVERYNCFSKKKKDLFGFGDIAAIKENEPLLIVQATSYSNRSARVKKILGIEEAKFCLLAGIQIEVWSWKKKKNGRYELHVRPITAEDF